MNHSEVAPRRIRILLVEDSPVIRELLLYILSSDPALEVVAAAEDGLQAVAFAQRHMPDLVLMDIHLPKLDGFAATRQIMETCPTRVVMITATSVPEEVAATFEALDSGALTVLAKPPGLLHRDHKRLAGELLENVKLMSELHVVKRWRPAGPRPDLLQIPRDMYGGTDIRVIAIGASTGGPMVLREILSRLPAPASVPILIVQHISSGFVEGFVDWLGRASGYDVRLAMHGNKAEPGVAYVAPDGKEMSMLADNTIHLLQNSTKGGVCPSVSFLFRSIAETFRETAIGVLLTGMGCDGAQELHLMRQLGAITIAQNKETSTVFGMPGEAINAGAATYILSPEEIALVLISAVKRRTEGLN